MTTTNVAAVCRLQVRLRFKDPGRAPLVRDEEVLVTDTPAFSSPVTIPAQDCQQIDEVELYADGSFLGTIPRQPVPAAIFTSEGTFHEPAECAWTPFAEAELEERLQQLLKESPPEPCSCPHAVTEMSPRSPVPHRW
jgi:hypothetical protein